METAFNDMFGVDITVDVKYNSLANRLELTGNDTDKLSETCETPLPDLLYKFSPDGPYGIYHSLLNEHWEYQHKS